ncbi:MAG: hypothetical protein K7J46_09605 [Bryobacter sp.]|jgi:hypothetical protein|nr:hypothetical protein [Bryobacter sp. CoA8 C33]
MAKKKTNNAPAAPRISSANFTETRKLILAEGGSGPEAKFVAGSKFTVESENKSIYINDILFNNKSVKEILLKSLNTTAPFKSITIQYKAR